MKNLDAGVTIPDRQHCFRLMGQMGMLEHIAAHSVQVCRVALVIVDLLKSAHGGLDSALLQAAALLHDITKTRSFETGENHAETGAAFLTQQGFEEVGDLVRQHVRLDIYPTTWPVGNAAILNYADKRVRHDAVVSLDERMEYILQRYGETPLHRQRIRRLWQTTAALEGLIFERLAIVPADLPDLLIEADLEADLGGYRQAVRKRS